MISIKAVLFLGAPWGGEEDLFTCDPSSCKHMLQVNRVLSRCLVFHVDASTLPGSPWMERSAGALCSRWQPVSSPEWKAWLASSGWFWKSTLRSLLDLLHRETKQNKASAAAGSSTRTLPANAHRTEVFEFTQLPSVMNSSSSKRNGKILPLSPI